MPRLELTQRALHDLDRLDQFLREKAPQAADHAAKAIRGSFPLLLNNPYAGRLKDEHLNIREWVIGFGRNGYRIAYQTGPDSIRILSVHHTREQA